MAFDFKKEYREFYLPKNYPELVLVPPMRFVAVRGEGDPNEPGGAYQAALGALYAVAYAVKMSKLGDRRMDGYFDFVVPPLEGFWQADGLFDPARKSSLRWISAIRLPDFVTEADLEWAKAESTRKKKADASKAELLTIDEGLCVQMLHLGPFDDEPASVARMDAFIEENGYVDDLTETRLHHEIYLSDARRAAPEKWKTVLRHPIRKKEEKP